MVLLGITPYVIFMFQSAYDFQKKTKIRTMKRWLLVRKTRKKQSQESRSFVKRRKIREFIFNYSHMKQKDSLETRAE